MILEQSSRAIPALVQMLALACACACPGQAPATHPRTAGSDQEAKAAQSPGLKVHGHWSFTVKNADGTVASRTEFENSLLSSGSSVLVGILAGGFAPTGFGVQLSPPSGGSNICVTTSCTVVPSLTSGPGISILCMSAGGAKQYCLGGLATSIGTVVQLAGQVLAEQSGTIGAVGTTIVYCGSSANSTNTPSPATCSSSSYAPYTSFTPFTATSSATNPSFTPIAVASGQIVQFTVTLSFS